ncbi:MAG: outer membrane protein transport protein [Candidatus Cloacimonetes bacterium]|nr:outer membrane protein transport protein [Candidatus Cloacimonadota bacterium]
MLKNQRLFFLIVFVISVSSLFGNGLSLNSIGSKALGMGGAFVGYANDATAIYWNPAGLAQQNSSLKFALSDIVPYANYEADGSDYGYPAQAFSIKSETKTNHYFNPNLFFNYRKDKMAFAFGIYIPAGLGTEYNGKDLASLTENDESIEWMSKIGAVNFSPAFAYQIHEKLSLGIAGNMYYALFEMKRLGGSADTNGDNIDEAFQYSEESTGIGMSATLATKFDITEKISIGLTYRIPTKVTLEGEAVNKFMPIAATSMQTTAPEISEFERELTWPGWFAAGIAFRAMDKLVFTFDAQLSQWSELDKLITEFDDTVWNQLAIASEENEFVLLWEDKTQIRFGVEYGINESWDIRCGYYYDPAPAPDETLNILFPSSTNNVLTSGFGYDFGKFSTDFGIEYLFGAERKVVETDDNMPGIHQMNILAYSLGINYNF